MPPIPAPVASVDVGTIRHRFNFDWAMSDPVDDVDTYWWWARSVRVDPGEVIADDDEGNLWSVPFTTGGEDAVTFGAPVRVRETFVPVGQGDGVTASAVVARRGQRVAASGLDRPAKPQPHTSASSTIDGQEARMTEEQLARIGLPADATDEQIDVRIDALAALEDSAPEPDAPVVPDPPITEPTDQPMLDPAVQERELVALRAALTRLSASETDLAARERSATRERVLSAAVASGRITPHERGAVWEPFYDASPAAATERLESLPATRVPLSELGHAGDDLTADPIAEAMNGLGGPLDFAELLGGKER